MNTKTTAEYTSNPCNGGIMGRDSPAALLDMLAEVASRTLHSEKKQIKSLLASQCKPKADFAKRKAQGLTFNVPQLLSMPASQLVKQFSIFTSDELKRQYSYTCALVSGCGQKYTSFASEGRARMSIKAHLAEHLEYLKTDKHAYTSFVATSVKSRNPKTSLQHKKVKLQQGKKPQEALNKENKDVIMEESTNYLRKILLNDMSFKEFEKQKALEKTNGFKELRAVEAKEADRIDVKVLGDHSYYERAKEDIPSDNGQSTISNIFDNTGAQENIVLMVVGTDSVHMKEYSQMKQEVSENVKFQDSDTVYLSEIPWSKESGSQNMEMTTTAKPKGKAKFIGTSKEEREMALAFMDRIKKKGNPTGSNLQCRICDPPRSFTAPTTLVSHYRSHAGIKPYECRICRAVFTRRHSLKYHMLIHQNQTRFTCADCGKKFRHPSHFREHRRRHTGEAPFGCDDCGQRFKTRNTYKRHLKTRHGKVLTTTGELLYLSEEDFQKVRTNRKKKADYGVVQKSPNEDAIAPQTIMDYHGSNDQEQLSSDICQEYIIDENGTCNAGNWKMKGTVQMMKSCFEDYEIQGESQLNKTEYIETEIPILSGESVNDGESLERDEERGDKSVDGLPELQSASYNSLDIVQDEDSQVHCEESVQDGDEIVYDGTNQIIHKMEDGQTILEYEGNVDFLESQLKHGVQILQDNDETYCQNVLKSDIAERRPEFAVKQDVKEEGFVHENIHCNNNVDQEKYGARIIISEESVAYETLEEFADDIPSDNASQNNETHNADIFTETLNSEEMNILQVVDKCVNDDDSHLGSIEHNVRTESSVKRIELSSYQRVKSSGTGQCVIDTENASDDNRNNQIKSSKQHLYVHAEPLNGIIVQNKCISVLPQQLNLMHDQSSTKIQLTDCRKITFLNKQTQAINLVQDTEQGAILLLSGDSLKNGILQIGEDSIAIKEIQTQSVDRSK